MNFLNTYDEMDGYHKDDIPILDVGSWYSVEDFEMDVKDYGILPEWIIIDNIVYRRKIKQNGKINN